MEGSKEYMDVPCDDDSDADPDIEKGTTVTKGASQEGSNVAVYGVTTYDVDGLNEFIDAALKNSKKLIFLRKVYLLLCGQLSITCIVSAVCMYVNPVRYYVLNNLYLYYIGLILSIIMIITLHCIRSKYPCNLVLLTMWTLVESYLIGVICGIYVDIGLQDTVLQAFILTIIAFVGLTIFTLQSRIDFTFLKAGLFVSLWVLIFWGLFMYIFGFNNIFLYCLFGIIIFCLFIIFDTHQIWSTNKYEFDRYGYIDAAIHLYLDLLNLFLYILQILGNSR